MTTGQTDLDDLADAARESMAAPRSRFEPVLVPASLSARARALVADAAFVLVGGWMAAGTVTLAVWGPLLDTDFDGPPQLEALGNWVLLATWGAIVLAYSGSEAFGHPTPGKRGARLRIGADETRPVQRARRLKLRWALAQLPVIVLTPTCVAGAVTAARARTTFDDYFWEPDWRLTAAAVVLGLYWVVAALLALAEGRRTLWDRALGVDLLQAVRPAGPGTQRGFEVVPLD